MEPIPPAVALSLAGKLKINPVSAVIHQYRRIGGDDAELVEVLSDMRLLSRQ